MSSPSPEEELSDVNNVSIKREEFISQVNKSTDQQGNEERYIEHMNKASNREAVSAAAIALGTQPSTTSGVTGLDQVLNLTITIDYFS
jgi:hypothetical protein